MNIFIYYFNFFNQFESYLLNSIHVIKFQYKSDQPLTANSANRSSQANSIFEWLFSQLTRSCCNLQLESNYRYLILTFVLTSFGTQSFLRVFLSFNYCFYFSHKTSEVVWSGLILIVDLSTLKTSGRAADPTFKPLLKRIFFPLKK